ncbi:MAG: class I SAM-dependent methyltransferase [Thermodesulfobacteriota bacterium]|nr:class I SAM-dependent methyltransferase [Thermodesulfobacteriota bacterium]
MALSDAALLEKYRHQAHMLANRAKKQYRHLKKRFARQNIEVFRIYDWDIPEIRAVVDWYAGHLVVGEYTRKQSTPDWLPMMGAAVAEALEVPPAKIHLKARRTGTQGQKRYERLARTERKIVMSERDFRFYVNLDDYVDTGLFSDHRDTRRMVREMADGKDFLNLFCYSGTFTCYAARGGARSTTSVDRSRTAIRWARENLALNSIPSKGHTLVQAHVFDFLEKTVTDARRFDLAIVDPPSFATSRDGAHNMDIAKDHPRLLEMTAALMKPGGTILFSTNHQAFVPRMERLGVAGIQEITSATIPEDYRNRKTPIHRCWKITVSP